MPVYAPYCGQAPIPGTATWNLDPVLLGCLAFAAAIHLHAVRTQPRWKAHAAGAGWAVTGLALVSPLCSLGVALFSARVGQHMVLALVAAPLLAVAFPRGTAGPKSAMISGVCFAVLLWGWHLPSAYDATFHSTALYWTMHLSILAASIWLCTAVLAAREPFAAAGAGFLTGLQMSGLGALLTFAGRPLFRSHQGTTGPWGLSALEDQQLGGLIMWIPGCLLVSVCSLLTIGFCLKRAAERVEYRTN